MFAVLISEENENWYKIVFGTLFLKTATEKPKASPFWERQKTVSVFFSSLHSRSRKFEKHAISKTLNAEHENGKLRMKTQNKIPFWEWYQTCRNILGIFLQFPFHFSLFCPNKWDLVWVTNSDHSVSIIEI